MDDEIETSPPPAVKNLRSKFESLAVSNDGSPPARPVSWNGSSAGTPKPRVASTSLAPVATSNTQTSSSELKGLKRPPPPPPTRGSRPTTPSPMPSPLLRAVPAPPSSPESQRHAPRMPSISLIDTDVHEDDTGVKGVVALRSRFLDVSPSRESLSLFQQTSVQTVDGFRFRRISR
ncbi:hypothetical protein CYLTODRAFT_170901 [Cylindrobasidium torrendii FP15055 ss-10]|uniref:Uncharacterized protein n=1 Tax=Cylindrobasidium torrendii FP15055 ss-10 TaxID=1314674 RepID=A0A0D7AZ61_9AGAR|nr:hypothetical protein CYLTODRAFT_170901 [Cylindrobasidium torrendii FP15055 ss-10]